MSLGKHTKCDLSFGIAKLDIEILTKQVEIHFYNLVKKMQQTVSNIQNNSLTAEDRKKIVSEISCFGSDNLKNMAEDLAETAELLHTLQEKTDRKIEIV